MKILSIVGARPQFIKLAPLSNKLAEDHSEIILHTGQHFDNEMSNVFFKQLGISNPKYNLNIHGGSHGLQTGRMLIEIEKVIKAELPDLVIVFGDTNTTAAGALASAKIQIPIVHVEAGLRSFNKSMPEEINRIITDHSSDYLFAPTLIAMNNLKTESLASKSYMTGDIMSDAIQNAKAKIEINNNLPLNFTYDDYYLCTLHRPYNVDDPQKLGKIIEQLNLLSKTVIFPVHPRTKHVIDSHSLHCSSNIKLIKPVGYLEFVSLQNSASKIITDSGGIQKESYILQKPCITLRSETEWLETVEAGWNLLVNPGIELNFAEKIESFIPSNEYKNLFGQNVAIKMASIIQNI